MAVPGLFAILFGMISVFLLFVGLALLEELVFKKQYEGKNPTTKANLEVVEEEFFDEGSKLINHFKDWLANLHIIHQEQK